MKKIIRIALIALVPVILVTFWVLKSITVWPAVEGTVIDKRTGKPIANVEVEVLYHTMAYIGGPGGPTVHGKAAYAVTDQGGKFRLEQKTDVNLFTRKLPISVYFYHPLYLQESLTFNENEINQQLTRLEDSFMDESDIENGRRNESDFVRRLEVFQNGYYWKELSNLGIDYDIQNTFEAWDRIAGRVVKDKKYSDKYNDIKKEIEETIAEQRRGAGTESGNQVKTMK